LAYGIDLSDEPQRDFALLAEISFTSVVTIL
jgi:hypothetical protein